jgi:hypothetical protein
LVADARHGFAVFLVVASIAAGGACGARTGLAFPDGGDGGAGCPAPSMVVTATIGGGIHHQFLECFAWPDDQPCPDANDAPSHLDAPRCSKPESVDCGPERNGASCCYLMTEICALT